MRTVNSLLLPLTFALAGCGGDANSNAGDADWPARDAAPASARAEKNPLPKACALVTGDEVAEVLGQSVGLMGDDPENCVWASAGNPGQFTMLMVQLLQEDSPAQADTLFGSLTGMPGALNALVNEQAGAKTKKSGQDIEGLGDVAWLSASNADLIGTQQLIVRDGAVILQINITGMTKNGKLEGLGERMQAAARTALERM